MVWSEFLKDSVLAPPQAGAEASPASTKLDNIANGTELPDNVELTFEDWKTWYSDDLQNMWRGLTAYVQDATIDDYLLCYSNYNDFCSYVYDNSKTKKKKQLFNVNKNY